jgi:hypothetical protein
MTFRDDLDATLARIDVLEREIRGLIDENSRLRRKRSPYVLPPRRLRVNANLEAAAGHIDVLARLKARLYEENENIRAGGSASATTAHEPKPWPLHDMDGPDDQEALSNLWGILVMIVAGAVAIGAALGN